MDTCFTFHIAGEDEALKASAAAECFRRIDELETILSKFNDSSDVALIRNMREGEVKVISGETVELIQVAAKICEATSGAYDPTVEARSFARMAVDPEHRRVAVRGKVELDFGGIGKGFALDECRKILESEQYELGEWLLDAGTSTILVRGRDWKLGVGGPYRPRTRLDCAVTLREGALSGSGFEIQGAHVRDVRRGGKAKRWEQSWAVAKTGAEADALSTAALSMTGAELAKAAKTLGARILVARNQAKWLDEIRDPLKWFGGNS